VDGCGFGFMGISGRCSFGYFTIDLSGTESHRTVAIMFYRVGKVMLPEYGKRDMSCNEDDFVSSRTAQTCTL